MYPHCVHIVPGRTFLTSIRKRVELGYLNSNRMKYECNVKICLPFDPDKLCHIIRVTFLFYKANSTDTTGIKFLTYVLSRKSTLRIFNKCPL